MKKHIKKRRSSGKYKYFTLTHSSKKYNGWNNRYSPKANIHGICYKNAYFYNDRFHSCILTDCNFSYATLFGVDFICCNLKKSSFKNSILHNVTFFNCNVAGADFCDAKFDNVVFMSMNLNGANNMSQHQGYEVINTYPSCVDENIKQIVLKLSSIEECYKYRVLNVDKNKINAWYLSLLLKYYKDDKKMVLNALETIYEEKIHKKMLTLYSYKNYIDNYKNI